MLPFGTDPSPSSPRHELTHIHHVANLVVAQGQHLQLDQGIQRVNLGDAVVEQAQVLQVHQCVQPLDGLNVVEGQVWKEGGQRLSDELGVDHCEPNLSGLPTHSEPAPCCLTELSMESNCPPLSSSSPHPPGSGYVGKRSCLGSVAVLSWTC